MMRASVREKMLEKAPERRNPSPRSKTQQRVIVHVDMDAFFAAVEERDNPALRGRPVIVGGTKGSRGVVTTANYTAREYGVHAGMSITEAERRCPQAAFVSTQGGKYTSASIELMKLLRRFSPTVSPYSIDEAFLDATGCIHLFGDAEQYGQAISRSIQETLCLTGSIGIGPSRIVAKMASGMNKPNGLTIVEPERVTEIFGPLPVRTVPGVGPATERTLAKIGIGTIQQLMDCSDFLLSHVLGIYGRDLKSALLGRDGERDRVVAFEERPDDKSMGHERTFSADVGDPNVLHSQLLYLSERVTRRMRKESYLGRIVTVKLRTRDFVTRDHQKKLESWTDDPLVIYTAARQLLAHLWNPGDMPIRLIGVTASGLVRPGDPLGVQQNLFNAKEVARRGMLLRAVDTLQDQFGEKIVRLAAGSDDLRKPAALAGQT